jgi:SAM-dependent methyltransferase
VDTNSKYRLQSITDIVKVEAANHGIHIDGLQISDRLHINDLVRICAKAWFPEKSTAEVSCILQNARAKAFSRKYAEPREDEKLVDVTKIKIDGLKPWQDYFINILNELEVKDPNQLDIINVGIGNGYAEEPFLSKIHSFKAVDISEEALQYAKKKYPQMTSI